MVYELADASDTPASLPRRKKMRSERDGRRLVGSTDPYRRDACARARTVFNSRHDCKNDYICKRDSKSRQNEARGRNTRSLTRTDLINLSPAIRFHAGLGEVSTVQDVLTPFVNSYDSVAHRGGDSNKQSQFDDHFGAPNDAGLFSSSEGQSSMATAL